MEQKEIQIDVIKAEASETADSKRIRTGEIGNPYLKTHGTWIQNEQRKELTPPYNLRTYEKMRQDATVGAALGTAEAFLTKALYNAKFKTNSKNQAAIDFCNYLNWNFKNFKDVTWYDSVINILTYLQYGFSWLEKVYEPNYSKKYSKYQWKIKKLAPRSQHSIADWKYDDEGRNVVGLRQYPPPSLNLPSYARPVNFQYSWNDYMKRNKFLLFSWDAKNSSPIGTSPLNACYKAYKEKVLIESIQVSGVSKGISGCLTLRVPSDHINKAAEDPESDVAKALKALQQQAALMHSGDQTFIMLGSDTQGENGNGKYVYDFEMKGVEGAVGQTIDIAQVIDERKKAILDVFGAGFINLGNDAVGSYSLADAKTSLHAFFMEKHMLFIQSVIQNDLVKQMMEINSIYLEESELPIFQLAALDGIDPEEYGKLGQRLGAVGLMPLEKNFLLDFWSKCGLDVSSLEDMSEQELMEKLTAFTSRSGDGMSEGLNSGTGSSLGNNSAVNSDNAA